VPEVLLSGHHDRIERWRRERRLLATAARRPDLLGSAVLADEERELLERLARRGESP
jgi:tRNA (guanine37-N1)-methyltransferase